MGAPIERGQLEEAIRQCQGNQAAAARLLGITPAVLAHKLAAEGLLNLCRQLRAASRPQSAPELQAVEPPPRAPAPAPYQRPAKPWDGVVKRCAPDPRIAARSFNPDDVERVPKKSKNWTGRRVR